MKKEKLLPKSLVKKLVKNDEQVNKNDNPMVLAKYFYPDFSWTWYAISYDEKTEVFFGLVDGFEREFGSFSLEELVDNRGKLGCEIERDLYFKPIKLKDLQKQLSSN